MAGRVQGGDALGTCGRVQGGYSAQLQLAVSGEPLVLGIQIFDYHGPGQYSIPPERLSLHSPGLSAGSRFLPAVSGMLKVDAGEVSGLVYVALSDGAGGAGLHGTWTCRAQPPA